MIAGQARTEAPPPLAPLLARVTLRALTVRQPWATATRMADPKLLGEGGKRLENRGWPPWAELIGQYVAIHAGVAELHVDDALDVGRKLYGHDATDTVWRGWMSALGLHSGALVCVAKLVGCFEKAKDLPESQRRWRDTQKFGWLWEDVRALERPITIRGAQGFWAVPPDIERNVREQVKL